MGRWIVTMSNILKTFAFNSIRVLIIFLNILKISSGSEDMLYISGFRVHTTLDELHGAIILIHGIKSECAVSMVVLPPWLYCQTYLPFLPTVL